MAYIGAFAASLFYAVLYNTRGWVLVHSSICGLLGKVVYDVLAGQHLVIQFLIPTIVMCVYAEIFARVCKVPVLVITTIGILPVVPGAGVYNTIDSLLNSHMTDFYYYGINTLLSAGAMALGLVLVSSLMRLIKTIKRQIHNGKQVKKNTIKIRMR